MKILDKLLGMFSYREKVGLLIAAGVIVGLGGLFMYLLRAHTYFIGDDPSACVNCHIMTISLSTEARVIKCTLRECLIQSPQTYYRFRILTNGV